MSTHYMDEADILGDRIGIMVAGKITCIGTSIFLKKKFGVGYNMTVLKTEHNPNTLLIPYLKQHLGEGVHKQSEVQLEIVVKIPDVYSTMFIKFFPQFDKSLTELKVNNYGISISTLEEVFMKVGNLTDLSSLSKSK